MRMAVGKQSCPPLPSPLLPFFLLPLLSSSSRAQAFGNRLRMTSMTLLMSALTCTGGLAYLHCRPGIS